MKCEKCRKEFSDDDYCNNKGCKFLCAPFGILPAYKFFCDDCFLIYLDEERDIIKAGHKPNTVTNEEIREFQLKHYKLLKVI